jgi:hypothetical protein
LREVQGKYRQGVKEGLSLGADAAQRLGPLGLRIG